MKRLLLLITIFISTVSFGQVPSYVPTNGMVAYWPFNGNANDESGNGYNGAIELNPSLTSGHDLTANSAYDFEWDNVTGYGSAWQRIEIPSISEMSQSNLTINAWINPESFYWPNNSIQTSMIIGSSAQCVSTNLRFVINPNGILAFSQATGVTAQSPQNSVVLNQWQMVTVSATVDSTFLFVNGLQVAATLNTGTPDFSGCLVIGEHHQGNGHWYYFDGIIDNVGLWNRKLTECEILDLYEGSLGNCCVPDPITSQPTDVAVPLNGTGMFSTTTSITSPTYQWQMDNGTGYMDLTNAGQFSGVDTDMLTVSNVTLGQNNTLFRCIVTENSNCSDTTDVAILTVEDNTGLYDLNKDIFNVYPNPTSNSFTISSEKVINSEFKIIDAQGREVLTGSMNGQEHTIDISKLSNGVYSVVFNNTEYPVVSVIKE